MISDNNAAKRESDSEFLNTEGVSYKRHRRRGSSARRKNVQHAAAEKKELPYIANKDSFCIHFASSEGTKPSWEDFKRFISGFNLMAFCRSQDGVCSYDYYNPATKVGCRFLNCAPASEEECCLVFELPVPCPAYFAMESFVMALALARNFDLRVQVYPVSFRENKFTCGSKPVLDDKLASLDQLLEIWEDVNAEARSLWEKQNGPAPEIRRTELETVWEYRTLEKVFRGRYSRKGYKYAEIMLAVNEGENKVFTMCDWNSFNRTVFPDVSYIRFVNADKYGIEEKIVNASELFKNYKSVIKCVPVPMRHFITKEGINSEDFIESMKSIKSEAFESYKIVNCRWVKDI